MSTLNIDPAVALSFTLIDAPVPSLFLSSFCTVLLCDSLTSIHTPLFVLASIRTLLSALNLSFPPPCSRSTDSHLPSCYCKRA